jgi:predicted lactoylglutathione lyase
MNPQKIWANLTVADLDRTTSFYTALGFQSNGASKGLSSFFFGAGKFIIHFFLTDVLKANVAGEVADLKNGNEIVFTLYADTRGEVDQWQDEVRKAGGTIVTEAAAFGPGYYGFVFTDPDGHKFNVFQM